MCANKTDPVRGIRGDRQGSEMRLLPGVAMCCRMRPFANDMAVLAGFKLAVIKKFSL